MEIVPVLVFGIAAVILMLPRRSGEIERWRGGLLLLVYTAHLVIGLKG
jgi:hypothetical protein